MKEYEKIKKELKEFKAKQIEKLIFVISGLITSSNTSNENIIRIC